MFLFTLTWGDLHGAYLPVTGPAPLRYQPERAIPLEVMFPSRGSGNRGASQLTQMNSSTNLDDMHGMVINDQWSDILTPAWWMGADQTNSSPSRGAVWLQAAAPGTAMPMPMPVENVPSIHPQDVIPYLDGSGEKPDTNSPPASLMLPVEFIPPNNLSRPSSTATYIKR